jgi:hypothetical protein
VNPGAGPGERTRSVGWHRWRIVTGWLAVLVVVTWGLDVAMGTDLVIWGALDVLAWLGR